MIKFQWSFEAALNFFLLDDGNSKSPKATLPSFSHGILPLLLIILISKAFYLHGWNNLYCWATFSSDFWQGKEGHILLSIENKAYFFMVNFYLIKSHLFILIIWCEGQTSYYILLSEELIVFFNKCEKQQEETFPITINVVKIYFSLPFLPGSQPLHLLPFSLPSLPFALPPFLPSPSFIPPLLVSSFLLSSVFPPTLTSS